MRNAKKPDPVEPTIGMSCFDWLFNKFKPQGTPPVIIPDGYNDEAVLIAKYDPDQMARCIEEKYTTHFSVTKTGAEGDPHFYGVPDEAEEPEGGIQAPDPGTTLKGPWGKEEYIPEVTSLLAIIESHQDRQDFLDEASSYISKNLGPGVKEFYKGFVVEVLEHSLRRLAVKKGRHRWAKASKKELQSIVGLRSRSLRERIAPQEKHRPKGSGAFESNEHFRTALTEVLAEFTSRPSQPETWKALTSHKLFRGDSLKHVTLSQGKSLRNWLKRIGVGWEEALKSYWKPPLRGK